MEEREELITDWPLAEAPIKLPPCAELRRKDDQFALNVPEWSLFCAAPIDCLDERTLKVMWNNIAGAQFDREFPNVHWELHRRNARARAKDEEISEEDKKIWARLNELNEMLEVVNG